MGWREEKEEKEVGGFGGIGWKEIGDLLKKEVRVGGFWEEKRILTNWVSGKGRDWHCVFLYRPKEAEIDMIAS